MSAFVVASAGVHLSVTSSGLSTGPTIVLVHGFPDTRAVWDRVIPLLESQFHVVAYDVRGAGASSAPASRSGYVMDRLVDDLAVVIDRAQPNGQPVHLVGHDWGSVQLWGAVMRERDDSRLTGRIASYTSISGPGLDLFGHFLASGFRSGNRRTVLRQLAHSWYIAAFQLPFLPEFIFRRFGRRLQRALVTKQRLGAAAHWAESFPKDGANGVNLYRANRLSSARGTTSVPIQLLVPTGDAFITPDLFDGIGQFALDVRRENIEAGHWVVRTHPDLIADRIATFVTAKS